MQDIKKPTKENNIKAQAANSSIEQMPSPKPIYSVLSPVQRFDLTPVKDLLLYPNRYFRAYKTGEKIGRYTTSLYNALDEANCL